jgi:hypothetical protein
LVPRPLEYFESRTHVRTTSGKKEARRTTRAFSTANVSTFLAYVLQYVVTLAWYVHVYLLEDVHVFE